MSTPLTQMSREQLDQYKQVLEDKRTANNKEINAQNKSEVDSPRATALGRIFQTIPRTIIGGTVQRVINLFLSSLSATIGQVYHLPKGGTEKAWGAIKQLGIDALELLKVPVRVVVAFASVFPTITGHTDVAHKMLNWVKADDDYYGRAKAKGQQLYNEAAAFNVISDKQITYSEVKKSWGKVTFKNAYYYKDIIPPKDPAARQTYLANKKGKGEGVDWVKTDEQGNIIPKAKA